MTKKIIRSITINPSQMEDIIKGCNFHNWNFSRWMEEAIKFQIMADRKSIAKAESTKMDPEKIPFEGMSEERFNEWIQRIAKAAATRNAEKIAKTPWIEGFKNE